MEQVGHSDDLNQFKTRTLGVLQTTVSALQAEDKFAFEMKCLSSQESFRQLEGSAFDLGTGGAFATRESRQGVVILRELRLADASAYDGLGRTFTEADAIAMQSEFYRQAEDTEWPALDWEYPA